MKVIIAHLYRGVNRRYWATSMSATFLIFISIIHPILEYLREGGVIPQGYHDAIVLNALSSDVWMFFTPILAGIPFASEYVEDIKSKFVRSVLIRESYSSYLLGHSLTCWFSGGFALLLGVTVAYVLVTLIVLPMESVTQNTQGMNSVVAVQLLLLALNGGLWANVGMAMSTFMESKYIAFASPFVVYYLLVILCERYIPSAYILYPKNWITPEIWPYGAWSTTVFLLELTLAFSILFAIRAGRRLREL